MYTSVMMVAMFAPGAAPVVSQAPVRQVVYAAPGQVIYIVSSPPVGLVSPVSSPGTIIYSPPVYYSGRPVMTSYSTPVYSNGSVVRYGSPVYSGVVSGPVYYSGVSSYSSPVSYAPASAGVVCRT